MVLSGKQKSDAAAARKAKAAKAKADEKKVADDNKYQIPGATYTGQDGSFSQLLYATLMVIGGWRKEDILIEKLPEGLFPRLTEIAQEFEAQNDVTRELLEEFFKAVVGTTTEGGADTATDSGVDVSGIKGDTAEIVWKVGIKMGVPDKALQAACITGFIETGDFSNPAGGDRDSVGWRQERASIYDDSQNVAASAKRYYTEVAALMAGKTRGKGYGPKTGGQKYNSSWNPGMVAQGVQGSGTPGIYQDPSGEKYKKGIALYEKFIKKYPRGGKGTAEGIGESAGTDDTTEVKGGTGKSTNVKTDASDKDLKKLLASANLDGAKEGFTALQNYAKACGANNFTGNSGKHASGSEHYSGKAMDFAVAGVNSGEIPQLEKFAKLVIDNLLPMTHQVIWKHNLWQDGKKQPYAADDHMNHVHISLKGKYLTDKKAVAEGVAAAMNGQELPDDGAQADADSTTGVASVANADSPGGYALAAALNLPGTMNRLAAGLLTGEKALMNDVTLFPFIQQLTEASMRSFQSLPDGRFYAFYPDYFGEFYHRPPYWSIKNIEILDGKINLSDEQLVTHSYVVGSLGPNQMVQTDETQNMLRTAGVVTIYNAFLSDSLLDRTDDEKADLAKDSKTEKTNKGSGAVKAKDVKKDDEKDTETTAAPFGKGMMKDKIQAGRFLQRYGARVEVSDNQFIYNRYFELFSAYQKFMLGWSRQFLTEFTFTFMPELYPGGKVEFPDHGIQMYIEEVTHEFDYETGFTTSANLSAPAVTGLPNDKGEYKQTNPALPPNMSRALVDRLTDETPEKGD